MAKSLVYTCDRCEAVIPSRLKMFREGENLLVFKTAQWRRPGDPEGEAYGDICRKCIREVVCGAKE